MTIILTLAHIKSYILQTFLGLEYLHAHWILHRVRTNGWSWACMCNVRMHAGVHVLIY